MKVFLDSNIFLRAILRDDADKANACLRLLEKIDRGEVEAATSTLVLNEILWVLEGYKVKRLEIAERLEAIAMSEVEILGDAGGNVTMEALGYYRELGVDFTDALNACIARENGIRAVATYDSHFQKLGFIRAIQPDKDKLHMGGNFEF